MKHTASLTVPTVMSIVSTVIHRLVRDVTMTTDRTKMPRRGQLRDGESEGAGFLTRSFFLSPRRSEGTERPERFSSCGTRGTAELYRNQL